MKGSATLALALPPSIQPILYRALAAGLAAGAAGLMLLALSGWFLTAAAMAGAAGMAASLNYLIPSAAIRALAIIRTVARYGERLWSHEAALAALAHLRSALFARLASADPRAAPDLSSGEASAWLIGDIGALEDLIVRRPAVPTGAATALFGTVLAGAASVTAALATGAVLAATLLTARSTRRHLLTVTAQAVAAETETLRRLTIDYADARPEIIAYGLLDSVADAIAAQATRVDRLRLRLVRIEAAVASVTVLAGGLAAGLIVLAARGSAPMVALALLSATAACEAIAVIVRAMTRDASVDASLARLESVMALKPDATATQEACAGAEIRLGSEIALPGARVAIIGPSGSGKTRLVEALAGMRPPVHDVTLGGLALDRVGAKQLSAQIAVAPQNPMLIAGSIADNLRLARPGVDAQAMADVLGVVQLAERIAQMPIGVDTPIGEAGGFLSGGERKRLSLARALLADRPWLVLDEPTEGLDATTERAVIDGIERWLDRTGAGLILVSHRTAPLRLAARRLAIADIASG